ncbi:DedA family protein [Facilibium subflavum]|uniref:DedA family protein n=1 Tax=Facilibium subflavum TaxID=2219058 RepID=UPI0013C312AC|nr:VTT domain-containing protein [Facilibium subflavum]
MIGLIYTHYFWLSLAASALNSAVLAVVAGFATNSDHGNFIILILLLTIASHLISFLYFIAGRLLMAIINKFLHKHNLHPHSKRLNQVNGYIKKYRLLYIFMYRFLPGLRFISPYIIGINAERFLPFFIIDWFAAFIWAVIFGTLGYLCGAATLRFFDDFASYDTYIYITIGIIVVVYILFKGGKRLYQRKLSPR